MSNTKLKEISSDMQSNSSLTNCMFDSDKFDKILFDLTSKSQPFSGERYTPGAGVQICYEHLHRYLFASQLLRPGHTVLDLGCGIGYGSILLAGYGVKVIAVDIDPVSTKNLEEIAEKHQLKNLIVRTADVADHLKIVRELNTSIDIVICHEVIEHLQADIQKEIVSSIGKGTPPYHFDTVFLVSTPDKDLYDQHLSSPNPFHLNELSLKEFGELLKSSFKNCVLFEQNTATANYLTAIDYSNQERVSYFELNWQDSNNLVPSLSKGSHPPAEYIYAVASNKDLSDLPSTSLLLDSSNQYIRERLSITAKELRENHARLAASNRLLGQLKTELHISKPEDVQQISDQVSALNKLIERQTDKIKDLQSEVERVGYDLHQAYAKIGQLKHRISALEPWHEMAGSLLAATPEDSAREVYRLKSYEAAMNSKGHKIVSLVGKIVKNFAPIRYVRRSTKFMKALYKA